MINSFYMQLCLLIYYLNIGSTVIKLFILLEFKDFCSQQLLKCGEFFYILKICYKITLFFIIL
jgi:hypothetical protein